MNCDLEKHILAAYYNDARLNILACLNDVREKSGKKRIRNEDQISQAFSDLKLASSTPEQQDELVKELRYRFPFLDVLTDAGTNAGKPGQQDAAVPLPRYYESHLSWMFRLINELRNTMAHPVDPEVTIPFSLHKKLYHALRKVYRSSFHEVKKRFGHETKTMDPFKFCGKDGSPRTLSEFSLAVCLDPKNLNESSDLLQSVALHDFGHVLFCSLFLEKSQSAELIGYFWDTESGCQWPDTDDRTIIREMAAVYRSRLPLQRLKSDDTSTAVTLDTLSELSRCPRALLDMLSPEDQNRFRGSPGSDDESGESGSDTYLFARSRQDRFIPLMMRFFDFDDENRIRFAIDLGQFYYNVRLKPTGDFADGEPRVRRLGQKIIAYGRLLDFDTADKPADWLQLEENHKVSRDEREALLDNAGDNIEQLKPYLVQTYPHYHYFDDKIGFRLANDDKKAKYPDLKAQDAAQPVALDHPHGYEMQPEFWMSQGQMLALSFYNQLLKNNTNYRPLHHLLKKYQADMRRLFNKLQQGDISITAGEAFSSERKAAAQAFLDQHFSVDSGAFHIALNTLPKVVINHLIGAATQEVTTAEVIERANHLLKRTIARQQRIKDQLKMLDKKRGQKGFRPIKCGPMGDFLAEDLMRFQPVDGNKSDGGKINSQQYQILQKTLAYYGAHITEPPRIVDLLKEAGLLNGVFAHPFITELGLEDQPEKYRGLISFYEAYLKARARYLEQFILEHKNRDKIDFLPHWLRLRQPSTLSSWLDEQLDENGQLKQPLPLVNNMLYVPILNMVAKALDTSAEVIEEEGTQRFLNKGSAVNIRPSITWLIKRYLSGINDSAQVMYSEYPRRHRLFDTYLDSRTKRQKFAEKPAQYLLEAERQGKVSEIQDFLTQHYPDTEEEVERIKKMAAKPRAKETASPAAKAIKLKNMLRSYKRNEQQVRFSVSQDMLLYLSARQYLETLQLSDTGAPPVWSLHGIENTLLKTEIDYRLPVADSDKTLFHPTCKIRDRGELSLLVRDRRLPSLMKYYPESEKAIHHSEIRNELNSYRRAKVAIMKMTHSLENELVSLLGDVPRRNEDQEAATYQHFGKGRHGDFLYALYDYYHNASAIDAPSQEFEPELFRRTLLIRNAFSHNEYPAVDSFTDIELQVNHDAIPEQPANHRKVAERFRQEMETLYTPWLAFLTRKVRAATEGGIQ